MFSILNVQTVIRKGMLLPVQVRSDDWSLLHPQQSFSIRTAARMWEGERRCSLAGPPE